MNKEFSTEPLNKVKRTTNVSDVRYSHTNIDRKGYAIYPGVLTIELINNKGTCFKTSIPNVNALIDLLKECKRRWNLN